jgi:hypothetical protein
MTTLTRTPTPATSKDVRSTVEGTETTKPNGPALAALLSAGIGATVLGVFTTLAQAHAGFKALMDIDKNLGIGIGVGPLSGKTVYAVAAWLISWAVAAVIMRGKRYDPRPFFIVTFVLVGLGMLGTFPLFFENFPVLQK